MSCCHFLRQSVAQLRPFKRETLSSFPLCPSCGLSGSKFPTSPTEAVNLVPADLFCDMLLAVANYPAVCVDVMGLLF